MGPWHARRAGASHRRSRLGRLDRVQRRGCSKRWMVERTFEPLRVAQKGRRREIDRKLFEAKKKTETHFIGESSGGQQRVYHGAKRSREDYYIVENPIFHRSLILWIILSPPLTFLQNSYSFSSSLFCEREGGGGEIYTTRDINPTTSPVQNWRSLWLFIERKMESERKGTESFEES